MMLGTPAIGHIVNVIKESEMDVLATPWVNTRVVYLLALWQATAKVEDDKVATKVLHPTEYDELIITKESEMIDTFLSKNHTYEDEDCIHQSKVECDDSGPVCWGRVISPRFDDTECLHWDAQWQQKCCHHGKEWYGLPSDPKKKIPVVRVVAANQVPEVQMQPGMIDTLDDVQGIQTLRMTSEQR